MDSTITIPTTKGCSENTTKGRGTHIRTIVIATMNTMGSYYSAFHITNIAFNSVNFFCNNTTSYNNEYTCMQ